MFNMKTYVKPTWHQVDRKEIIHEDKDTITLAVTHPQWGGYVSPCLVEFSKTALDEPGCYDVYNFHDGDFPSDDSGTEYHYCAATQMIRFGISILELQFQYQKRPNGHPPLLPAEIDRFIERLQKLREEVDQSVQS